MAVDGKIILKFTIISKLKLKVVFGLALPLLWNE
jgi:hypothetical protein